MDEMHGPLASRQAVPQMNEGVQRQEAGASQRCRPRPDVSRVPEEAAAGNEEGGADIAREVRIERAGLVHPRHKTVERLRRHQHHRRYMFYAQYIFYLIRPSGSPIREVTPHGNQTHGQ